MKSTCVPCASAKRWKGHVLGILFSQRGDERHVELSLPTLVGPSLEQSLRWPVYMRANDGRFRPLCLSVLFFILLWFNAAQFSRSAISTSLWPHGLQHARPPCPSPTPGAYSDSFPLSWWCHPTISSSVIPSPPAFNLSQHQDLFKWVSSLHQVAKALECQFQHLSFQWIFRTHFL